MYVCMYVCMYILLVGSTAVYNYSFVVLLPCIYRVLPFL